MAAFTWPWVVPGTLHSERKGKNYSHEVVVDEVVECVRVPLPISGCEAWTKTKQALDSEPGLERPWALQRAGIAPGAILVPGLRANSDGHDSRGRPSALGDASVVGVRQSPGECPIPREVGF